MPDQTFRPRRSITVSIFLKCENVFVKIFQLPSKQAAKWWKCDATLGLLGAQLRDDDDDAAAAALMLGCFCIRDLLFLIAPSLCVLPQPLLWATVGFYLFFLHGAGPCNGGGGGGVEVAASPSVAVGGAILQGVKNTRAQ